MYISSFCFLKFIFFLICPLDWYSVEGVHPINISWVLGFGQEKHGEFYPQHDDGGRGAGCCGRMGWEDGLFRLDFRKFKNRTRKNPVRNYGNSLAGATSDDDYFIWSDF